MRASRWYPLVAALLSLLLVSPAFGQARGNTELQAARAESETVLDLGRLLGFVYRMTTEFEALELSDSQVRELLEILQQIRATARLDGPTAEAYMIRIEDRILTAAQLIHTDRLWIQAERARGNDGSGTGVAQQRGVSRGAGDDRTGEGSGTSNEHQSDRTAEAGELAVFAAGGDFNPLLDASRPQGESFEALSAYLDDRIQGR